MKRVAKSIFPLSFALISALAFALACGGESPSESKAANETESEAAIPERIITMAPSLTEMVYALGEQDRLVGVSDYCKFPPEAQEKPHIGALVSTNYEQVLALEPDLVVLRPDQARIATKLEGLGIASVQIRAESLADVFTSIQQVGELLGKAREAAFLSLEIQEDLAKLEARSAFAYGSTPPRVLLVVGRSPGTLQQIYAAGTGAFLSELLEATGAANALQNTKIPWPIISREALLALDPDIILDASRQMGGQAREQEQHIAAWSQMPTLRAVREGRIVTVQNDHMMIPGPSVAKSARMLAELIDGAIAE